MSRKAVFLGVILLLIVVSGIAVASIFARGISARDQPTWVETVVARTVRHFAIPSRFRAMENPLPASEDAIMNGLHHFADHCATCHGNDGRGNTSLGKGMFPPPPDMTLKASQSMSDGEIYAIIQNGIRLTGMPAFGDDRTDDESTWKLVHFIRHLPDITGGELLLMKTLNPKTPAELATEAEEDAFLSGEMAAEPAEDATNEHQH